MIEGLLDCVEIQIGKKKIKFTDLDDVEGVSKLLKQEAKRREAKDD
jgi:hypothetical protein